MRIESYTITRRSTERTDIFDVTSDLEAAVRSSGIRNGHVVVFVPGSTAAVTTIEFEEGVLDDLRQAIERLAPRELPYRHDARWGDGNGYAHVRAALLGPSVYIPLCDGRLRLGTWQQVVVIDFDNRPRTREVLLQVEGE